MLGVDNFLKNIYNIYVLFCEGEKEMLKKYWKKIGMLILIIACVFNVMAKLVNKMSLNKELLQSAQYIFTHQENQNKDK